MTTPVALSTALGEVMEPETLVTSLVLFPDGQITVDAGALHGRSQIEGTVQFVQKREQVPNPQVYWFVWVAVELEASHQPVRYKGLAVSELFIDRDVTVGYRSVSDNVNRISEAMQGGINLKSLDQQTKARIRQQLASLSLSAQAWEQSSASLKEALA